VTTTWGDRLEAGRTLALGSVRRLEQSVLSRVLRRRTGRRCEHCADRLDRDGRCPSCGQAHRLGALEWVDLLTERGSFRPLGAGTEADPLRYSDDVPYPELLRNARARTGVDESVVGGRARIGGHEVALVVFDFGFLGGSIGVAAGDRLVETLAVAEQEHIPAVLLVCSSGARMQEGLPSLLQMPRMSAAVVGLRQANVPLIAVLADPTTGAGYASCASLADVVLAERRALVNFAGPRVVEAVSGKLEEPLRAEDLETRGLVDQVVARAQLARAVADLLRLLDPPRRPEAQRSVVHLPPPGHVDDRWALLQTVRRSDWPTGSWWLRVLADRVAPLRGDRTGADDPALVAALAEIGGAAMLVLATDRLAGEGLIGAAGYRKARRALTIAARLGLPVLTLVDGPGAAVGRAADEAGIAPALAESLAALLEHPAPTIGLVVGEGSSGGAMALAATDRLFMLERSTFSVISPEGAAAILDRLGRPAETMSDLLRVTAADAFELGLVDGVVPEGGGGRLARRRYIRHVRELVLAELASLHALSDTELAELRQERHLVSTRHLLRPLRSHSGSKEDAA
jgi:acetyl-CoA carboxylase carboxyl transferase subunit beta